VFRSAGLIFVADSRSGQGMAGIRTPCIRVCVVHPVLQLCIGCGRSLDEIGRWMTMTDDERSSIMAELPPRLVTMASTSAPRALLRG
jgi:hypothetical protein